MAFSSQDNIRSAAFSNGLGANVDYTTDNLFTGVWRLDQSNLNKFDPFVGGYAGIVWTQLPAFWDKADSGSGMTAQFKALTERNFKAFSGIGDLTLDTDALSTGFAGNELPVATNIKKENTTFTIKHYELAGSPIRELYQYWITGIRDPETGLATYHGAIANGMVYSMKNHTAELLYIVTDPSFAIGGAIGIEFACYYTNVFPTKIPQDHLNYSSGDHAITEIDQEFRGNYHQSSAINNLAVTAMKSYTITKTYGDYNAFTSTTSNLNTGYNEV
jgi:hypothetical protein